jgi:hypothetical protein
MANKFDTDPAAEIAYLKALEKAAPVEWPVMPDDPAKLKKAEKWPAPVDGDKDKKFPRRPHSWLSPEMEKRQAPPMTSYGQTWGDKFIFLALLGATLYLVAALLLEYL